MRSQQIPSAQRGQLQCFLTLFHVITITLCWCSTSQASNSSHSHSLFGRPRREANRMTPFTEKEKKMILDHHNKLRGQVKAADMLPLTWSSDLEESATRWADGCDFNHPTETRKAGPYSPLGQNLYAGTAELENVYDPVQEWYDEVKDYTYQDMSCTPGAMCGHYTQVIWASTKQVGCAIKYCDSLTSTTFSSGYYVVCDYGPAGNYRGRYPYAKGDVCSKCPSEYKYCHKNLCSMKEISDASPFHPDPLALLVNVMASTMVVLLLSVGHMP